MKVLLVSINAKYIHTNNAVRLLKINSSFNPEILEFTIKDDIADIINQIESKNADIIGLSVYIWNVTLFTKIIDKLRLNNAKLILGGPEVSYEPSFFLKNTKIDFIIKGEGELSFELLLQHLSNNSDYSNIPGLSYKLNNKLYHNEIEEIDDLSIIKSPYYFTDDIPHIPSKISYIESSRGCPYKCSYCLSSLEKKVRFFDNEEVKKAILYLMNNGSKTIKFLDRTFNANKNTLDLLAFIIKHNNNKTVFQFEITGDILSKDIINYLNINAPKHLFRFEIGIQSINYETNYLVDRFQDTEKLFENIKLIQKGNIIDLHLDLIAGLPKEDKTSFIKTFDEVFKLSSKELQLGFLKMLRGTKIRREAQKYSYIYHKESPYEIIMNDCLSKDDIKEIHLVEHMLEIHHNKGYFRKNMLKIILSKESSYNFFLNIGNHYIKNNYSMRGYQIEDIYSRVFEVLNNDEVYSLKQDYLLRSKIKPKIFFNNNIEKQTKNRILNLIGKNENITINKLYKHSVLINKNNHYFCVLYENNKSISFEYNDK
jgi:radical SAM superfamily enzyme YgiQ (UPF0313 family)